VTFQPKAIIGENGSVTGRDNIVNSDDLSPKVVKFTRPFVAAADANYGNDVIGRIER